MMKSKKVLFLTLALLGLGFYCWAQSSSAYYERIQEYEPSDQYPFGRLHPDAPSETSQFDFMVGICDCTDSVRTADGSWFGYPSVWRAKYFLNGYAIQDNYFHGKGHTSNLRIFDPKTETWKVTFMQVLPNYFTGTWEGGMEGSEMVLSRESTNSKGIKTKSRLTFYNISEKGYDWKAEQIRADGSAYATWKQFCKKRK